MSGPQDGGRFAEATRRGARGEAPPSRGKRARREKGGGGRSGERKSSSARRERASGTGANGRPDGRGQRSGEHGAMDALVGDIARGGGQRWFPGLAAVKLGARLATRPQAVARRGLGLAAELARVAAGRSDASPEKGDRRFKDPAWQGNPAFRRLLQTYLAAGDAVDALISDADLDWRSERRVRFAAQNVLDAVAPSNVPLTNPTVLKAVVDSGGKNFVQGARHALSDMRSRPFLPSSVDESKFEVGRDLAVTPGSVVLRNEVFELIQYRPRTERVREAPLLLVPQMINKYYVADLAPGRSIVEHALDQGQQVFAISWRNPDERFSDWNLDTYCRAALDALEAVEKITGSGRTHLWGLCAGGNIAAMLVGHLTATGEQDRIAGLTLGVTVIDWSQAGTAGALLDDSTAAAAIAESARKGYLDGRDLAGVFAWMRPNDMVWGYVVNNYLLGKPPPPFDVLYWNADQTNMPAALHRDFVQLGLENPLTRPDALTVLDTPIDLSKVTVDSYLIAGIADHISPWRNAYRTTQLLGSEPRFVLSTSGHIVAMVNPPGNEKANFKTNDENPEDPEAWLKGAATHEGTWWPHWTDWLGERSGDEKPAPEKAGGRGFEVLDEAPGTYVHETA